MTCATCRHALPVNPQGNWRAIKHEQYIHCSLTKLGTAQIIPKERECGWEPSRWVARAE